MRVRRRGIPDPNGRVVDVGLVMKLEDQRDALQQVQFGAFTGQMSGS